MKLGIFLQHYFPYGGLQRDAARLARAAGDATLVVSTSDQPPADINLRPLNSGGTSNHRKLARFAKDCQSLTTFDRTIAFSRVPGSDFHFCGDTCFRERFQKNKPAVAALLPRYKFLLENEQRIFGPESDTHIFFLAESEIPAFEKHYRIKSSRYTILPPWLDKPVDSTNGGTSILRETNLSPDTTFLLFVASNYQLKGLDRAIRALADLAKKHPDYHLVVCGRDDEKPFQKLGRELHTSDRLHFLGSRDDIPAIMAQCHLLVHPARQETAGMVLIEALVQELPVLCTSVCGYSSHTLDAGCTGLSANPECEEIARKIEGSLEQRDIIVPKIREWCAQPNRYRTADIMLERIALGL